MIVGITFIALVNYTCIIVSLLCVFLQTIPVSPAGIPVSDRPFTRTSLLGFVGPVSLNMSLLWFIWSVGVSNEKPGWVYPVCTTSTKAPVKPESQMYKKKFHLELSKPLKWNVLVSQQQSILHFDFFESSISIPVHPRLDRDVSGFCFQTPEELRDVKWL